ncbi:MAG: hypothetical protein HZB29_11140 [Nitrospinae bacterium]|nr:hypothetical protein [Nitrospinota bacterium]
MPQSYEAIYDHGQLKWVNQAPGKERMRVIVTEVPGSAIPDERPVRRRPSPMIAGKGKTLGDIISPVIPESDWECLK